AVSANPDRFHDPGLLHVTAQVGEKVTPEQVRDAMLEIVEDFVQKPATKEEVERAKASYLADHERALSKSETIALDLSEWIGAGDWRLLFVHRDCVAKVTPEDVNRVAAKYLKRTNRTSGILVPTGEVARVTVPETPDIVAMLKDYKGGKAI